MLDHHRMPWLLPFLALTLALAGCGSLPSPADPLARMPDRPAREAAQVSPLAWLSPLATPAGASAREPVDLVVLHTNDNWGETEPCG
jgi:hypothetical protein